MINNFLFKEAFQGDPISKLLHSEFHNCNYTENNLSINGETDTNCKNAYRHDDFPRIKRKKYAMYSTDIKRRCIEMSKFEDPKIVAKKCAVPLKSLKRWLEVGPERKKGGGRKIRDPEMEHKLFGWYNDLFHVKNIPVTAKMIKQKALEITRFRDFIASKGWLEKFKKKYKLELSRGSKISYSENESINL